MYHMYFHTVQVAERFAHANPTSIYVYVYVSFLKSKFYWKSSVYYLTLV